MFLIASADNTVIQQVLDPARLELPAAWLLPALLGGLVVTVLGGWALYRVLRGFGPAEAELDADSFVLGIPLSFGALMLPWALHYLVRRDAVLSFPLEAGVLQVAVALGCLALLRHNPWRRSRELRQPWWQFRAAWLPRLLLAWVLAYPVLHAAMLASVAFARLAGLPVEQQEAITRLHERGDTAWVLGWYVSAVGGAPLWEEFVFRLVLFGGLRRLFRGNGQASPAWRSVLPALAVSVTLFVLAHGFWVVGFFPLAMLSLILCGLYVHTRSIWPSVLFHAMHNALVLTLQFYVM